MLLRPARERGEEDAGPDWRRAPSSRGPGPLGLGLWMMAPRTCRSTNRPSVAEPEVWFRILQVAEDGGNGTPAPAYLDQTVEIALGPTGAFENGNVGTLKRRVNTAQVVSAMP